MIKTTVYLPASLKRALEQAAAATGKSEARFIRDAVAQMIDKEVPPRPRLPLFASGDPTLAEQVDELLSGFGE